MMQVAQADQLVGKKLGAYKVEHLLGQGQLSAVYLARQVANGNTVLMTIFRYPASISAQERKQLSNDFAHEGAALIRLRHPNILPTYEFGEQSGYPYLVTAFAKGASLAQLLKQQKRLTPEQTLSILQQLAEGLDYAHSNSVTHGNLSLSNVLVNTDLAVQIAGFGLKTMLEANRDRRSSNPQSHLVSATGTFLGNATYIEPERVQGVSSGARVDIYALGVMLYEMLSGAPPFHGASALETALLRIRQPVPSLRAACPDLSEGFDLVIGKALALGPAHRYQHAGEVARSYERVFNTLGVAQSAPLSTELPVLNARAALDQQVTMLTLSDTPGEEDDHPSGKWQLIPPVITDKLPALAPASRNTEPRQEAQASSVFAPRPDTGQEFAVQPAARAGQEVDNRQRKQIGDSLVGTDPFAWWTTTVEQAAPREAGIFAYTTQRQPVRLTGARGPRQAVRQDRRQAVKLIATGAVVAGVFAAGGISFARFAQSVKQATQFSNLPTNGSTTIARGTTPAADATHTAHPSPTATRAGTPKATPTHATRPTPTAQPTRQPTPKPTPSPTPGHTGTVIGSTSQAINSSITFTNPADGQSSLLIHLQNGNFVACERACTHAGVPVDYNSGQTQIVCPAHGAIFDPLNGFAHLSGPGNGPLATVNIRVNADGTITTG